MLGWAMAQLANTATTTGSPKLARGGDVSGWPPNLMQALPRGHGLNRPSVMMPRICDNHPYLNPCGARLDDDGVVSRTSLADC